MITVENLTKSFPNGGGNLRALDGVSMEVPAGAVCGVVGPSGAGKSTLARCVALLEKPDSGAIRVDGTDLLSLDGKALRAARRQIGVVPQGDSLLRQRTAAGNVALPLEAAGVSAPQRRARVAELEAELAAERDREREEARSREQRFGQTSAPRLSGRDAVLVDDGLATGATARAAVRMLREESDPRSVLLAVPVGAPDAVRALGQEADEVLCVLQPVGFSAVGQWYRDFRATSDEEIDQVLREFA